MIDVPLSGLDIATLTNHRCKIETYPNLHKYNNLSELFEDYDGCMILYMTSKKFGHWILLFKLDDDNVEFFNSYGGLPDDDLEKIDKNFRNQSNQNYTYLLELLYNSPYIIHYNQYKFQKKDKNVQTCGRWGIVRLLLKDLSIDEFYYLFKGLDGDKIVTAITLSL